MSEYDGWNRSLAVVVDAIGAHDFFSLLIKALRTRVMFERPQAWLYQRHLPPQLAFHDIDPEFQEAEIDMYLEGPYREDPFFAVSMTNPSPGLYRLSDLIEGELEESNYYASYYNRIHIVDELMILIPLGVDQVLNICLLRSTEPFGVEDVEWLRSIAPLAVAVIQQHVARDTFQSRHPSGIDFDEHVNCTLDSFGSSVVTGREQEVLRMTLQGYSTAVAAERLNISVETMRRHRKNIYRKLDLSSQADLFALFINVLRSVPGERNEDSLVSYLSRPAAENS